MNRKTRRGNNPANPSDGLMRQFLFMTGVVTVMIVLIIAGVITLVAALKVLVPALEPAETRDIVDVLDELGRMPAVSRDLIPTPTPQPLEQLPNLLNNWNAAKEVIGAASLKPGFTFQLSGGKQLVCGIAQNKGVLVFSCDIRDPKWNLIDYASVQLTRDFLQNLAKGKLPAEITNLIQREGVNTKELALQLLNYILNLNATPQQLQEMLKRLGYLSKLLFGKGTV